MHETNGAEMSRKLKCSETIAQLNVWYHDLKREYYKELSHKKIIVDIMAQNIFYI